METTDLIADDIATREAYAYGMLDGGDPSGSTVLRELRVLKFDIMQTLKKQLGNNFNTHRFLDRATYK